MYGIGIVQVRSDSYERIHRASLSLSLSFSLSFSLFLSLSPPPPPFSLRCRHFGTTYSGRTRGTDSHTSRVSIKRRRKWRAFLDRCGLHGSAKRAARWLGKQGEKKRKEEHALRLVLRSFRRQHVGARDRKCHRAVFLDYRHFTFFFLLLFFFFFTYRRSYHGLLASRVLSSPSISVHNSVRRGYFYSDCSLAACGTGRGGIYSRAESRLSCGSRG